MPTINKFMFQLISDFIVTEPGIEKLHRIKPLEVAGPDALHGCVLMFLAPQIEPILTIIYSHRMEIGQLQDDWRKANITSAFKSCDMAAPQNYTINYAINIGFLALISTFLSGCLQRVVLVGQMSSPQYVNFAAPLEADLSPLLFLLYINDLPEELQSIIRLFGDDSLLYRENFSIVGSQLLSDLNKL